MGLLAIELRDRPLSLLTNVLVPENAVSARGGRSDIGIGLGADGPA